MDEEKKVPSEDEIIEGEVVSEEDVIAAESEVEAEAVEATEAEVEAETEPETDSEAGVEAEPSAPLAAPKGISKKMLIGIIAGIALIFFVICGMIGCSIGSAIRANRNNQPGSTEATKGTAIAIATTEEVSGTEVSEQNPTKETVETLEASTEESTEKTTKPEKETKSDKETKDSKTDKTTAEETIETTVETQPAETKPAETQPAETKPQATEPAKTPQAESGTPVGNHGQLRVQGTQIVDQNGTPYQLKGVSTHGIAWFPGYVDRAGFQTMRDEWGVNAVRLAMYSGENSGYCTGGNQSALKTSVKNGVNYATELGMYVIIDWHVLGDQNPNVYKTQAIEFFKEMAQTYKGNNNVIYEICNEPNGGTSWSDISNYANEVIPAIRAIDPDAIIIVGTPTWSQDVDQAAKAPLAYDNVMYALHFYAATHTDWLRQRMISAINSGLPIFVSEYGICDASGNGGLDIAQANAWVDTMNQYGVSYMIWNLSNKNESSSLIASGCNKTSNWSYNELSESGKWFVGMLGKGGTIGTGGSTETKPAQTQPQQTQPQQTQPQQTQPQQTEAPQPEAVTLSGTSGAVTVTAVPSSGWAGHIQYSLEIKNDGAAKNGWTVTMTFTENVKSCEGWCGNFETSKKTITITPMDWNSTIDANGSMNQIGMTIETDGKLSSITIK